MKHYYDSKDVKQLLGLGCIRTAQLRIQALNVELVSNGYWVERGKVPIKFFHEKYPYVESKKSS